MKQTRPHLQISPLGLVNKYGSKYPKTSQKPESHILKQVKNQKAIGLMAQLSAG